jgi:hypothetical protein
VIYGIYGDLGIREFGWSIRSSNLEIPGVMICHVSLRTVQNLSELYLLMIFAILTVPGYITASFVKRCEELA